MSSIPTNKSELITAIEIAFTKLHKDYLDIPEALTRVMAIEGNVKNTKISICDTLAYLIGWGKLILKWVELKSQNQPVNFPETGYNWNQLGLLAQSFQQTYRQVNFNQLLTLFENTNKEILSLINQLDDKILYANTWYEKYTLGRMIQLNTSSPMKNIRTKVRRFKKAHIIK